MFAIAFILLCTGLHDEHSHRDSLQLELEVATSTCESKVSPKRFTFGHKLR